MEQMLYPSYDRIRIRHTYLTHSHLLKDEDPQYVYLVILYYLYNICRLFVSVLIFPKICIQLLISKKISSIIFILNE